ncbi:Hpt domain-containing protein [Methylobacterium sp. C25]|uniref:Hpt domain-containing protein n=1 Tax=Methylobacterium sp. C25 TaxID=2721622 RepID=UPI001F411AF9|nr:Hpt domain-containing protein [Methylobacterium sp. C25]MCE4225361.1 Hpt domain-containing protein [Methylobacterium sp. C25]
MGDEKLLDRAHLDTQTFGDKALAQELLGLFAEQCRQLMPGIADTARSEADRADLAHTLKGSAFGVGAVRVAARAAETEDALRAASAASASRTQALAEAVAATLAALDATA